MPTTVDISSSDFANNKDQSDILNTIQDDLTNVRAPLAGLLRGSATYDAASLADGVGATTAVTVTGAALGDFVVGVSFSLDLQDIGVTAYVSAADTVEVRFQNEGAATVDLASGTIRVAVLPQASFVAPAALVLTK